MKIFKNYSVILGLAFTLLFFSACGKKESDDEIKLPLETAQVAKKVVKKHPLKKSGKTKSSLNLRKHSGVLITAELISENKITPKNLFAEVKIKNNKSTALSIALSTNYNDGQITFPEIKKGLTNLQIIVKADNIAETSSEFFDTLDGKDKNIEIKIEQGVVWQGNVRYADGTPVTNFYLRAIPRGLYENQNNIGHISKRITADKDGDFKITGLLNEHYKLQLFTVNAERIATNVYFCNQINFINFVFPVAEFYNLHGKIIYEKSDLPAEGIKVKFTCNPKKEIVMTTDSAGCFKTTVPKGNYYNQQLIVDEPGFAPVIYGIELNENREIIIFLREVGAVEGNVVTKTGAPIPGIKVKIRPRFNRIGKNSKYKERHYYDGRDIDAYSSTADKVTDKDGYYSITRVAAPGTYEADIRSSTYFLPNTKPIEIKVMPGKTTRCDIVLFSQPVVMLKFIEKNGTAILNYSLEADTKAPHYSIGFGSSVHLSENEEWSKVRLGVPSTTAILSLKAQTTDGKVGETNGIAITSGKTNFIVLTAYKTPLITATGFIYDYEMKPIIDKDVWAFLPEGGNASIGKSDHLGYFEIKNLGVKPGDEIKLRLNYLNNYYETNVLAGSTDIEWVMPAPKIITGRVCLENSQTPATNFFLGLGAVYARQYTAIDSDNGTFKMYVKTTTNGEKGKIFAHVAGYTPACAEFNFNDGNICNIGDIILEGKNGTIKGRVIDDSGNPMSVEISISKILDGNYHEIVAMNNNPDDGTFTFKNVPLETIVVFANSKIHSVMSKPIKLKSGETKIIPDLIIVTTNSALVDFEFLLPDGDPAGNADVKYFNKSTDENGELTERIRFGNYEDFEINLDGQTYYSEKFVINKNTTRIIVKLKFPSKIIGTATIDGKPLNNVQLDFYLNGKYYYANVFNGKFEFEGPEGLYSVFYRKEKYTLKLKLTKDGTNVIKFTGR